MEHNIFYGKSPLKIWLIGISALLVVLAIVAFFVYKDELDLAFEKIENVGKIESNSEIMVHVKGAVVAPGIYALNKGDRFNDLIEKAGGLGSSADVDKVNLASFLQDGEEYYVPEKLPLETEEDSRASLVNLNTARLQVLVTLPNIGQITAQRIIDRRTQKGPFTSIEQIKEIDGLSESKFEELKHLITVSD